MENYVGLKRSRTYQITETETVISYDEDKKRYEVEVEVFDSRINTPTKHIQVLTLWGEYNINDSVDDTEIERQKMNALWDNQNWIPHSYRWW